MCIGCVRSKVINATAAGLVGYAALNLRAKSGNAAAAIGAGLAAFQLLTQRRFANHLRDLEAARLRQEKI